jgi:ribosomal protein S7
VGLVRQLLASKRLFVSAHCGKVIDSLRYLKKGKGESVIAKSPHQHAFDALSYPLYAENIEMLETAIRPSPPKAEVMSLRV